MNPYKDHLKEEELKELQALKNALTQNSGIASKGVSSSTVYKPSPLDAFKDLTEKAKQKVFCRTCGKTGDPYGGFQNSFSRGIGVCNDCSERMMSDVFKQMIRERVDSLPENQRCNDCHSHINACQCPKSQAIKKLRE